MPSTTLTRLFVPEMESATACAAQSNGASDTASLVMASESSVTTQSASARTPMFVVEPEIANGPAAASESSRVSHENVQPSPRAMLMSCPFTRTPTRRERSLRTAVAGPSETRTRYSSPFASKT